MSENAFADPQMRIADALANDIRGNMRKLVLHGRYLCLSAALAVTSTAQLTADSAPGNPAKKPTVYIVLSVDTEPLRMDGGTRRGQVEFANFVSEPDSGYVARTMAKTWREPFIDSEGHRPKLTWFALTSEQLCETVGCAAVYQELLNFSKEMKDWEDEIAWHFHNTAWIECEEAGQRTTYWTQILTFNGSNYDGFTDIGMCESGLNELVVDQGFFPLSFRSGWGWENNDFSRWLENVVPFDFSSMPPGRTIKSDTSTCGGNAYDWSRATRDWFPYHPDSGDYQRSGNLHRAITRSLAVRIRPQNVAEIEAGIAAGRDQILSVPVHSFSDIVFTYSQLLGTLQDEFRAKDIKYVFATATEAMRGVLEIRREPPPVVKLQRNGDTVTIATEAPIFQNYPYVVQQSIDGSLLRLHPISNAHQRWLQPIDPAKCQAIYVAVSTVGGGVTVKSLQLEPVKAPDVAGSSKSRK